jgi:hypothetical protein
MVETLQQGLLKALVNRGSGKLLQKSTIEVAFDKAPFVRHFTAKSITKERVTIVRVALAALNG